MDFVSKDKRSTIMKSIRSSNTKPEISLRKFLFSNGIRYRINYEILPGRPDIVLVKKRLQYLSMDVFGTSMKTVK